ncbi:hypothetical protein LOTGIDRAFT_235396 [Lottia gigantea]|uniref:Integral membrane protein 2 n=1 Tax=Lottia gigantea TaxID=225164 RepID=V3ZUV9_LOTGI|nr:hypothetical protein LOTGIDRAFT_235396 [Lottia gigantea]ESO86330.1 hypothetical protein LOTGIDRAFT_235396 [Lottia gigantea]
MTIFKTTSAEKKADKFLINGEIVTATEPLTGLTEVDDLETSTPKVVRVTYNPRRTRTMVNLCLIVAALLVLGIGLLGAVYLYKHLSVRIVRGRCGVSYIDEMYGQEPNDLIAHVTFKPQANNLIGQSLSNKPHSDEPQSKYLHYIEEDVEVSEIDNFETLTVPEFDECEETVVWHDFGVNYTAIIDNHLETCFIMKLNRTMLAPPKDLIDLIMKYKDGYYMPSAEVIREKYRQVLPSVSDVTVFGPFIMRQCYWYDTYRLVKIVDGVYKRSVNNDMNEKDGQQNKTMKIHHYGFPTFKNVVYKFAVIPQ